MSTIAQPVAQRVIAQATQEATGISLKHILVATDFSPASTRAFDFALALAQRYGSELHVVHALSPHVREAVPLDPLPRELNRERLQAEREMADMDKGPRMKDVPHHLMLRPGEVWDVLHSIIRSEKVDLLVMGTHGRGMLKKLALGSVAEEVLRQAECPVVTVGPHVAVADVIDSRTILFATDFGRASTRALPYALSIAQQTGAKLVLLHMVPPVPAMQAGYVPAVFGSDDLLQWRSALREQSMKKLKELVPPGTLAQKPEYVVAGDFLPGGILFAAAEHKADLIIMGANRSTTPRIAAHLPWPVVHDVICESRCPVLTVSA